MLQVPASRCAPPSLCACVLSPVSSGVLTPCRCPFSERDPRRGVAGVRGEARRILGQEGHALLLLEGEGPPGLRGEWVPRRAELFALRVCGAASSPLRGVWNEVHL